MQHQIPPPETGVIALGFSKKQRHIKENNRQGFKTMGNTDIESFAKNYRQEGNETG